MLDCKTTVFNQSMCRHKGPPYILVTLSVTPIPPEGDHPHFPLRTAYLFILCLSTTLFWHCVSCLPFNNKNNVFFR